MYEHFRLWLIEKISETLTFVFYTNWWYTIVRKSSSVSTSVAILLAIAKESHKRRLSLSFRDNDQEERLSHIFVVHCNVQIIVIVVTGDKYCRFNRCPFPVSTYRTYTRIYTYMYTAVDRAGRKDSLTRE